MFVYLKNQYKAMNNIGYFNNGHTYYESMDESENDEPLVEDTELPSMSEIFSDSDYKDIVKTRYPEYIDYYLEEYKKFNPNTLSVEEKKREESMYKSTTVCTGSTQTIVIHQINVEGIYLRIIPTPSNKTQTSLTLSQVEEMVWCVILFLYHYYSYVGNGVLEIQLKHLGGALLYTITEETILSRVLKTTLYKSILDAYLQDQKIAQQLQKVNNKYKLDIKICEVDVSYNINYWISQVGKFMNSPFNKTIKSLSSKENRYIGSYNNLFYNMYVSPKYIELFWKASHQSEYDFNLADVGFAGIVNELPGPTLIQTISELVMIALGIQNQSEGFTEIVIHLLDENYLKERNITKDTVHSIFLTVNIPEIYCAHAWVIDVLELQVETLSNLYSTTLVSIPDKESHNEFVENLTLRFQELEGQ